MRTIVVNLRKEPYDVYCGRAGNGQSGYFGNPHRTVAEFKDYFSHRIGCDPVFKQAVEGLRGKRLGCFCAPKPCHVDVYVEYLEGKDDSQLTLF